MISSWKCNFLAFTDRQTNQPTDGHEGPVRNHVFLNARRQKGIFLNFFIYSCRRRSVSSCDWSRRATRTASSTTTCPSSRRASSRSDAPRTSTSQKSSKSSLTKKIRETRTFWADGKCQFSPFKKNIFVPFMAKDWCIKVFVYRWDNNLQHVFFSVFF